MKALLAIAAISIFSPMWTTAAFSAEVSPDAYVPIDKQGSPKLYKQWKKSGIDRINAAIESAVEITSKSLKCDKVTIGGLSFEKSVPRDTIVVFTECMNGERFYFTEDEAKTGSPVESLASRMAEITDTTAFTECEALAKDSVAHKSTMDVSWLNSSVVRNEYGMTIALSFEAQNAFGIEASYLAFCTWNGTNYALQSIKDR